MLAVWHGNEKVTDREGIVSAVNQIPKRIEISLRFRHLLAFDEQMLAVNPEPGEGLSCDGLALSDLVLVVWEDVVDAAAMNIESFSELFHRHRRTLDVPPRPACSEWRFPSRLFFMLRGFPENEVAGFFLLVFVNVDARAKLQFSFIEARQTAIARKPGNPIIDRLAFRVSVTTLNQTAHEIDHFGNVIRCGRHDVRALDVQRFAILKESLGVWRRVSLDVLARLDSFVDDFVVDVRDVHHVLQRPAFASQMAPQYVLEHKGSQVSDVREVVYRRTAGVHSYGIAVIRREGLQVAGQSVR